MNPIFLKRFLIVLYAAGLIGMNVAETSATFISLVPLTLWFTGFICIYFFPKTDFKSYAILALIAISAWFLEVVGVSTGKIFGSYQYGNTLGFKIKDVPLTIGINWLILVIATNAVVEEWGIGGKIGKAALGAGLMTALDLIIEPVAIHFDFWHWQNEQVPIQNFGAWWLASFFFHWIYISENLGSKSSLFRLIALLQFMFFLGHWAMN
ncbi:carotenoid biosynthesis protein [Aquirufa sp. ROCK-SH2]